MKGDGIRLVSRNKMGKGNEFRRVDSGLSARCWEEIERIRRGKLQNIYIFYAYKMRKGKNIVGI